MSYSSNYSEIIKAENINQARMLIQAVVDYRGPLYADGLINHISELLEVYRQKSVMRAAGIMGDKMITTELDLKDPESGWFKEKVDLKLVENLVWRYHGGEGHGQSPVTWKDYAIELETKLNKVKELEGRLEEALYD